MHRKTTEKNTDRLQAAWRRARRTAHRSILKSTDLSRGDRETLTRSGRLRKLMKGWYCLETGDATTEQAVAPGLAPGVFYDFLGLYLEDRLGSGWCLSAEASLQFRLEPESVPKKLIVLTDYGSTTNHRFEGLTELTVYHDPDRFPEQQTTWAGLRLMSPEAALGRLKPSALERDPQLIRKTIPLVRDWESLSYVLAAEGRHTAALRLAEELAAAGMPDEAAQLRRILTDAGYRMPGPGGEEHTFELEEQPEKAASGAPAPDADLDRLRELWSAGRTALVELCPRPDEASDSLLDLLACAQEKSTDDALHSLALSGFHCSREMVLDAMTEPERAAAAAGWPELNESEKQLTAGHSGPLIGEADPLALLALQGYVDAARLVRRSIVRLLEGTSLDLVLNGDLKSWHVALLKPSADAGLVPGAPGSWRDEAAGDFCGPDPALIPSALDLLWELTAAEEEPSLRANLAHLGLMWIRPWPVGNGRMARFLMNALLTAGHRPWLVIPAAREQCYREYLDGALAGNMPHCLMELAVE